MEEKSKLDSVRKYNFQLKRLKYKKFFKVD